MSKELALTSISDLQVMAKAVAASNFFGVKSPEQAMALMLIAQAEGMHPAIAARDYHVINGKPALKADAMLARFLQAGGKVEWTSYTDTKVSAKFSHTQGGSVEVEWDMGRAKKAQLGSNGMWAKYPRQMLRARVISEGIRTVYPNANSGFYTPEETQDMVDVTPNPNSFGSKAFKTSTARKKWCADLAKLLDEATSLEELDTAWIGGFNELAALKNGSEYDIDEYNRLSEQYETAKRGFALIRQADKGNFDDIPQHLASEVEEEI
jgi:hypothetical protein